jgi:hypothetical protein
MAIVFNITSFDNMMSLKKMKEDNCQKNKCKTKATNGYLCGRCRRMSQKICSAYHKGSPETKIETDPTAARNTIEELVLRITYDYVFDYINMDTIMSAMWLVPLGSRCYGHTKRLFNLASAIYRHDLDLKCEWLSVGKALRKRNECKF